MARPRAIANSRTTSPMRATSLESGCFRCSFSRVIRSNLHSGLSGARGAAVADREAVLLEQPPQPVDQPVDLLRGLSALLLLGGELLGGGADLHHGRGDLL